jgi:RND family efflux transporter MFP subunit
MRMQFKSSLASLIVTVAIGINGCSSASPAVTPEAPRVTVMHPEKRQLSDYEEFNGWMAADDRVEVRARVKGHIKKIYFTDGQYVKKGDLLFELDPRPFQADIGKASDTLKVYEAQKKAADKEEARLRILQTKGGASVQQVEKAEADALALAAAISAAKNVIDAAKLNLEYSRVTADIAGRVSKAEMGEGNLVNAGGSDPLLTTIVSLDPIKVNFNIDERSMLRYAKSIGAAGGSMGDLLANLKDRKETFQFALDGETGFSHQGVLKFGDNIVDTSTGTIQSYGTVPNLNRMFIPGSRVRVRLKIGKPYDAMLVPDTSILSDQDKRYVLVVDDKKTVLRRNVTLGTITDDGLRAIQPADKLAEGENPAQWQVIVDNLQRARLNYPVEIASPSTAVAQR